MHIANNELDLVVNKILKGFVKNKPGGKKGQYQNKNQFYIIGIISKKKMAHPHHSSGYQRAYQGSN